MVEVGGETTLEEEEEVILEEEEAEFLQMSVVDVTERNSYGLGYHNRQLDSRNQSFPICNRN